MSYLRVQVVDLFNRQPNISRMNRGPYLNPFLDRIKIGSDLDVGLDRKFLCGTGITIGN